MHIKKITEKELADLLEESINLRHDLETGGIAGVNADMRLFTVFQGGFSTSIVLISELPMPVHLTEPTARQFEELDRDFAALMAGLDGSPPPTA